VNRQNFISNNPKIQVLCLITLTLLMTLPGLANLQVIDRDEARYAQASIQMIENGDYVNIRFQDRARNKKPAGIYWMQAAVIKAFTKPGERKIWTQRLPSVLGALLAVLATYWGGVKLIGRKGAFIASLLLTLSVSLVFEAHIAKTDAMLCGLSALALGIFAHARNGGGRMSGLLFWIVLGISVMIKGPVLLAIVVLTILTLVIWERKADWLKPLAYWPGPLLFFVIILPWTLLIWQATDGQFFKEAVGQDFGGKLVGAQEKHSGPPGYYLVTTWLMFWPACLFLLPGLAYALKSVRSKTTDAPVMRLLLAWIVPMWIILEFVPTKLPHYTLPLFPALVLILGTAIMAMLKNESFPRMRKTGVVIYTIISVALCAVIVTAPSLYGSSPIWPYAVIAIVVSLAFYAAFTLWVGNVCSSLWASCLSAIILSFSVYQIILPSLSHLRISDRIVEVLHDQNIKLPREGGPAILSPHFREPSLVYNLGTNISLKDTYSDQEIVLLDMKQDENAASRENIMTAVRQQGRCLTEIGRVTGLNYSKGDELNIAIFRTGTCN